MATVREDSIPHVVRTAHEQRLAGTWNAVISQIDQINSSIRLIRLGLVGEVPTRTHLPGQYIDLSIPTVPTIGGFTITSPPSTTRLPSSSTSHSATPSTTGPYIELAIQHSPANPPAAYLWRPASTILSAPVSFRVGGTFVYPPAHYGLEDVRGIERAVFVAGGVGINPVMSMLGALDGFGGGKVGGMPRNVRVLYTSRGGVGREKDGQRQAGGNEVEDEGRDGGGEGGGDGGKVGKKVLFEDRLKELAEKWRGSEEVDYRYTFFETSGVGEETEEENIRYRKRRIRHEDLFEALGSEEQRKGTLVYICGVPGMTDEFVEVLQKQPGMSERQVCCEKWW